jgi:hypothetical protein
MIRCRPVGQMVLAHNERRRSTSRRRRMTQTRQGFNPTQTEPILPVLRINAGTVGDMRVRASPEAVQLVQDRGGKLYVWAKTTHCCGGSVIFLETSSEAGERPSGASRRTGSSSTSTSASANRTSLSSMSAAYAGSTFTRTGTAAPTSSDRRPCRATGPPAAGRARRSGDQSFAVLMSTGAAVGRR